MANAKPIASLTPTLLARKGGARPALRSPPQDMAQAGDCGETIRESAPARARSQAGSKVVALNAMRMAAARTAPAAAAAPARTRPSAFTLRLDAERHLKLRLASALAGRSAQQLVVEALDSMLASLPQVAAMAARAGKQR